MHQVQNGELRAYGGRAMDELPELLHELTFARWNGGPSTTRFAGSDGGARQAALVLAAERTGRPGVLTFEGCQVGDAGSGRPDFCRLPLPPCGCEAPWRDGFAERDACLCCQLDRAEGIEAVERVLARGDVGAVVVEVVVAGAGCAIPAPGFLRTVRQLCHRHGSLLIADETATGPARTGRLWAVEHVEVIPDIMVVGGEGLPFSAALALGPQPGPTVPDSPIPPPGAASAFDGLASPDFLEAVARRGLRLRQGLERIATPHRGRVRGVGMLLGVAVHDSHACPDPALATALSDHLADSAVPVQASGHVLILRPPLDFPDADADALCEAVQGFLVSRAGSVS
ncbi:N/A [soil metagenome]